MANYGVDVVEMDATHLNKDWKETWKEEKTLAKVRSKPNRRKKEGAAY